MIFEVMLDYGYKIDAKKTIFGKEASVFMNQENMTSRIDFNEEKTGNNNFDIAEQDDLDYWRMDFPGFLKMMSQCEQSQNTYEY